MPSENQNIYKKVSLKFQNYNSRLCTDEEKINDLLDRSREKYTH